MDFYTHTIKLPAVSGANGSGNIASHKIDKWHRVINHSGWILLPPPWWLDFVTTPKDLYTSIFPILLIKSGCLVNSLRYVGLFLLLLWETVVLFSCTTLALEEPTTPCMSGLGARWLPHVLLHQRSNDYFLVDEHLLPATSRRPLKGLHNVVASLHQPAGLLIARSN